MNNQKMYIVNPHVIRGAFNQLVKTPLGMGRAFGQMSIKSAHQEGVVDAVVVRLPIDETTQPRRKDSNCLTPAASKTGVWVFPVSEIGGGTLGDLALAAVVIAVIVLLGQCGVPW